jgi:hypothetical protein
MKPTLVISETEYVYIDVIRRLLPRYTFSSFISKVIDDIRISAHKRQSFVCLYDAELQIDEDLKAPSKFIP